MGVGMEVTIDQHFLDDGPGGVRGNAIAVIPCGIQRRVVVDLDAGDALLDQHPAGGVLPVDLGDARGILPWQSLPGTGPRSRRLAPIVQFASQRFGEPRMTPTGSMAAAAGRRSCASRARSARIARSVSMVFSILGRWTLMMTLVRSGSMAAVHLTDGSRSNRGGIDNEKQFGEGRADAPPRSRPGFLRWAWRDAVLQAGQLIDEFGRKDIRTGACDLAELDEGRPQFDDRLPQVDCGCLAGDGLLGRRREASPQAQSLIEAKLCDNCAEAVPHQHFGYSPIATKIARAKPQHGVPSTPQSTILASGDDGAQVLWRQQLKIPSAELMAGIPFGRAIFVVS